MVAPCCGAVIMTFARCCIVTCSNEACEGAHFCAWCDKVARGPHAHHANGTHVAECPHNPTGSVFIGTHRAALQLHTARKAIQFDLMCKAAKMPVFDPPKRYRYEAAEEEGRKIFEGSLPNFGALPRERGQEQWDFEWPAVQNDPI